MKHSLYIILYTLLVCLFGIYFAIENIHNPTKFVYLAIPVSILIANVVEYLIHRYVMHRSIPGLKIAIRLHMVHHNYFAEQTYCIKKFADFAMIVFPASVINITAFILAPMISIAMGWLFGFNFGYMYYATILVYYLMMQILHIIGHLNDSHIVMKFPIFNNIRVHHKIHHIKTLMTSKNFNFIFPISDKIFGTLL